MQNPVKILRINGVEYNANRDPQVYRRMPKQAFQIQATLSGKGAANIKFEVEGKVVAEKSVGLPGKFECAVAFDTPGTRVGMLTVQIGTEKSQRSIRLDVMDHAWIG